MLIFNKLNCSYVTSDISRKDTSFLLMFESVFDNFLAVFCQTARCFYVNVVSLLLFRFMSFKKILIFAKKKHFFYENDYICES